jgi:hypothetical protein
LNDRLDLQLPQRTSLVDAFDRVVVINLARRQQRLARFSQLLHGNWPFATPSRFEAIDGSKLTPPATWDKGPGAWGCQLSHLAVLDSAIADGVSSLLVLEDDAYPISDLPGQAKQFFADVPDDWDCLMLGTEHLVAPTPVTSGVVRCTTSIRSHAYAVRGPMMAMLSTFWKNNVTDHCDLVLSALMGHYKVYAPDPLLIGQDAGVSDVAAGEFPLRFFDSRKPVPPKVNPKIARMLAKRVHAASPAVSGSD